MPPTSLTPGYFRYLIRLLRPFPDFDFAFIKPLRARSVELLRLTPGARVLDLGCGPGGSFPFLVQAVGPYGKVVGVEISPEVAINARRRVAHNQWSNAEVLTAPAESVRLDGLFDAALMFGAPDIYASPAALANVLTSLRPGARVAFFGAKTSRRRLGGLLNPLLRAVFRGASFATTPVPDDAPWAVIAPELAELKVEEYFFGWMFLASGTVKGSLSARNGRA